MPVLFLIGCQTAQQKNVELVADRVRKLKPLSSAETQKCTLDVSLTQPAAARFKEMFPKEKIEEPWTYTWRGSEARCEIVPQERTPMLEAQKGFLDTAVCLLMQVYWTNSPFDELAIDVNAIEGIEEQTVHLKTSPEPGLGVFLDRQTFRVETRTKSRGMLNATYKQIGESWLPERLEQVRDGSVLSVEEFDYEGVAPGRRPELKGFWIFAGPQQAFRHSHVVVRECKPD